MARRAVGAAAGQLEEGRVLPAQGCQRTGGEVRLLRGRAPGPPAVEGSFFRFSPARLRGRLGPLPGLRLGGLLALLRRQPARGRRPALTDRLAEERAGVAG